MLLPQTITLVLWLLVTLSATHVIQRSYTETSNIRSNNPSSKSIEKKYIDKLDFDYDGDYDFERDLLNHSKADSENDSDVKANADNNNELSDNKLISSIATSQQKPDARPSSPLSRRDPKHKKNEMDQSDACGVHVVQKFYSRNIFSYRVFGPYAWNYQEIVRGQRSERRPFPVSIPLPMLPAKLNMTVTVDRDETMYPFANVYFEYGADSWKSSDSRCNVGGYDRNLADLNWNERRIDCSFACM